MLHTLVLACIDESITRAFTDDRPDNAPLPRSGKSLDPLDHGVRRTLFLLPST